MQIDFLEGGFNSEMIGLTLLELIGNMWGKGGGGKEGSSYKSESTSAPMPFHVGLNRGLTMCRNEWTLACTWTVALAGTGSNLTLFLEELLLWLDFLGRASSIGGRNKLGLKRIGHWISFNKLTASIHSDRRFYASPQALGNANRIVGSQSNLI